MSIRKMLAALAALTALAGLAQAQQNPPFAPINPPQAAEGGGKIEVIEFFWYGCPHCYSLEPEVAEWVKKAPADVVFKRVPAIPNDAWAATAQMYYTLEAMNLLGSHHMKVFDAIHRDRVNLNNPKVRDEWLAKNGVDAAKYNEMAKSFSVATKLQRAKQLTAAYRVDGVPRIAVDGKWYTAAEFAGGNSRIFPVVDQLVAMARKDKGGSSAAPAAAAAATPAPAPAKR
jgi:protein dithiol oxidoreductase (disulfide-forming)